MVYTAHTPTCRCAEIKRQREINKGKFIRMEFQPGKKVFELRGYQLDELKGGYGVPALTYN